MTKAQFIASYPQRSAARWFAARLVTMYGAQTEAHVAHMARECRCSDDERETVIGAALDAGFISPTLISVLRGDRLGAEPMLQTV